MGRAVLRIVRLPGATSGIIQTGGALAGHSPIDSFGDSPIELLCRRLLRLLIDSSLYSSMDVAIDSAPGPMSRALIPWAIRRFPRRFLLRFVVLSAYRPIARSPD